MKKVSNFKAYIFRALEGITTTNTLLLLFLFHGLISATMPDKSTQTPPQRPPTPPQPQQVQRLVLNTVTIVYELKKQCLCLAVTVSVQLYIFFRAEEEQLPVASVRRRTRQQQQQQSRCDVLL